MNIVGVSYILNVVNLRVAADQSNSLVLWPFHIYVVSGLFHARVLAARNGTSVASLIGDLNSAD